MKSASTDKSATAADTKLHLLDAEKLGIGLPFSLNDPFDYTPHPLCRVAVGELFSHIESHPEWSAEIADGKMFGVLIVRDKEGRTGFLAAFSGNLCGTNNHPYFVPPVYDMLSPDGFFRREEAAITEINRRIADIESSAAYRAAIERVSEVEKTSRERLSEMRANMELSKARRDALRLHTTDPAELERLDNESRREKSELRRAKRKMQVLTEAAESERDALTKETEALKTERKQRSEALQRELFAHFEIVSCSGGRQTLLKIFEDAEGCMPPAGAGECAAPKLLQYAFINGLTPLSIAEFWYGRSPKGEVRRHGSSYPACRGKCKPILEFMLQGIHLEKRQRKQLPEPSILFEDESIILIEKPAGMLSAEGKIDCPSVENWAKRRFAGVCEPQTVHRLDMDVSGLLLIAKNLDSYRRLQEQFLHRTVEKRYKALLQGDIAAESGKIELPMRPDPTDRPRQTVDPLHGKAALTYFTVKEHRNGKTLVEFKPVTGRTHQLRVHAASAEGLDAPIVGDTLYGAEPADRLYLHNEFIAFDHPVTGQRMSFESLADF